MSSSDAQDALAEQRDAKFKAWVQRKSVRDKAFEVLSSSISKLIHLFRSYIEQILIVVVCCVMYQYLGKLNPSRATAEESLKEVAISLCAVDRLLGNDEDGNSTTKHVSSSNTVQVFC